MAKKAPAKKAAKKVAKKVATKATKKPVAAAKTPAKKAVAKPAKKPAKSVKPSPPRKPPAPSPRSGGAGPVTFTVRVGEASLTMEYDGSASQDYEMVLFVKDDSQARRIQDCIDRLGLRKLVVAIARAYVDP